ncbi:phage portal protein [Globicatella sp. PHS-GS-PNBC-21-1553]|uniref:phage portal protein n=1 Tax=Globicatella sp. PHS-GS-PNBC-21-1553 TaxID=2885764 RepID=UPI00298EF5D7|nr:phage portal protein [Globicatella sp. PHS-GS-PNBC-21-1553]WPC08615.1 phage portal protein [Globicatella sp. PHS-GS-PNBC-21-1553]
MLELNKMNVGAELTKLINLDMVSQQKKKMKDSIKYYNGEHDILNYRMFYTTSDGTIKEEFNRANEKISHRFHTQLIDQKVAYLLSNKVKFETKNEELKELLKNYITPELQQTIYDLVEGASIKGWEGLYYYYDSKGVIKFQTLDSYNLFAITDDYGAPKQFVRYYKVRVNNLGKDEEIQRAEVFSDEGIYYFVKKNSGYVLDKNLELNPKPYKMLKIGDKLYKNKNSKLPILILENNKQRSTDLEPIKSLIDDYDKIASGLTNNILDFDQPVYMVKNYMGDNLDDLIQNLKTRRTVGVDSDGGLSVHTIDIPFEARKEKLSITRKAIYEFAMGYDSSSVGSEGNQLTNVGIKATLSLLDMKANKIETRLKSVLSQMLELILENIKELTGKSFNASEVEFIITRTAMTNDLEKAQEESELANAQLTRVNSIINASIMLDKQLVAEMLSKELGLNQDRVMGFIQSEDYIEPLGE